MTKIFLNSQEFENIYNVSKLTDQQFIYLIYGQLLHRSPDQDGLRIYLAQLKSKLITRSQMLNIFLGTDEFKNANTFLVF